MKKAYITPTTKVIVLLSEPMFLSGSNHPDLAKIPFGYSEDEFGEAD